MNVRLTARRLTLTPEVKLYCDKRLKGIEKNLDEGTEVEIRFSREKHRHGVELRVLGRRLTITVQEEHTDLFQALNEAFDGLEKKLKKEKSKLLERKRRGRRDLPSGPLVEEPAEFGPRVVPSADFSLKPMTVEEAILNLDDQKRDVFMFRKMKSEKWAVVYRRKDGHYGVVEPE